MHDRVLASVVDQSLEGDGQVNRRVNELMVVELEVVDLLDRSRFGWKLAGAETSSANLRMIEHAEHRA